MKIQRITEVKYYDLMTKHKGESFDELHQDWLNCFAYILKSYKVGFTNKAIKDLFYYFQMSNWKDLHLENTEYKGKSKQGLVKEFKDECWYISDRSSYDRLFRTHYLFLRAFEDELMDYEPYLKSKFRQLFEDRFYYPLMRFYNSFNRG